MKNQQTLLNSMFVLSLFNLGDISTNTMITHSQHQLFRTIKGLENLFEIVQVRINWSNLIIYRL